MGGMINSLKYYVTYQLTHNVKAWHQGFLNFYDVSVMDIGGLSLVSRSFNILSKYPSKKKILGFRGSPRPMDLSLNSIIFSIIQATFVIYVVCKPYSHDLLGVGGKPYHVVI